MGLTLSKSLLPSLRMLATFLSVGLQPAAVQLLHILRLGGYAPLLAFLLLRRPTFTLSFLFFYYRFLSRHPLWISLVRRFTSYAHDLRFRLVVAGTVDPKEQYILAVHPHGLLCEGVFYSILNEKEEWERKLPGLNYVSVAGPGVKYLPIYREIIGADRDSTVDPARKNLLRVLKETDKSIGISPGGFSEAVYADPRGKIEYSYIKGRTGFLSLAIEAKKKVLPIYSFNLTSLYYQPRFLRGLRARLAQRYSLPMVAWFGKWGTSIPLDGPDVVSVVGEPFDCSRYTLQQLEQCHHDYCVALKLLFDTHKHKYGCGEKELVFIGKDFHDRDIIPRAFRRIGVHTSHLIPNTVPHREEMERFRSVKVGQELARAGQAFHTLALDAGKNIVETGVNVRIPLR